MTAIVIPNTFLPATTISSTAMNANFQEVVDGLAASLALDGSDVMTGQAKLAPGTAAAPALAFGVDLNLGIYRRGVDELGFSTAGTLRSYFDAAGKFWALGAADITGALDVGGNTELDGTLVMSNAANRAAFAATLAGSGAGFGTRTNLASAATTDLGTIPSHCVNVTGAVTITAFGSTANVNSPFYLVKFASALQITHNAASMIVPGGGNLSILAGDEILAEYLGTGNWRIAAVFPAAPALSVGGANGLTVVNTTANENTRLDIVTTGRSILEATNGATISVGPQTLTLNTAGVGVNGLDAGVLASNTWYYYFLISNGVTVGCLLSTSPTAPTMPAGYVYKYQIGQIRTRAAAAFSRIFKRGRNTQYRIASGSNTAGYPIIQSGSLGNINTGVYVTASVSSNAPPNAAKVDIALTAGSGQRSIVSPNNQTGAFNDPANSPLASVLDSMTVFATIMLESTDLYYASNGSGGSLALIGWEDNLNLS